MKLWNQKTMKLLQARYEWKEEKKRELHFSECTFLYGFDSWEHVNDLHIQKFKISQWQWEFKKLKLKQMNSTVFQYHIRGIKVNQAKNLIKVTLEHSMWLCILSPGVGYWDLGGNAKKYWTFLVEFLLY